MTDSLLTSSHTESPGNNDTAGCRPPSLWAVDKSGSVWIHIANLQCPIRLVSTKPISVSGRKDEMPAVVLELWYPSSRKTCWQSSSIATAVENAASFAAITIERKFWGRKYFEKNIWMERQTLALISQRICRKILDVFPENNSCKQKLGGHTNQYITVVFCLESYMHHTPVLLMPIMAKKIDLVFLLFVVISSFLLSY